MLSEGQQTYKETPNEMARYELKQTPTYEPQKGTLDYALDQYLKAAVVMAQEKGIYDSYRILTSLGSISIQDHGNNLQNENNLIQNLENRQMQAKQRNQPREFKLQRQLGDPSKGTDFFHVKKNVDFYPEKRIYLNCKKENIAVLAYNLMNNFEDLDSYYLKFSSDKLAGEKARADQIVIYLKDDKQLMDIVARIEKTKAEYPQLFEMSENINPFMKNYGGYIAYSNQPLSHEINIENEQNQMIEKMPKKQAIYNDMKGGNKLLPVTCNDMLATALEESFVNGVNGMLDNDPSFVEMVKGMRIEKGAYNNSSAYVMAILPKILENDQMKMNLIANMKAGLKVLSEKNPTLEINGIDQEKQQENSINYPE